MSKQLDAVAFHLVSRLRQLSEPGRIEVMAKIDAQICRRCGKIKPCECKQPGRPKKSPKLERARI